MASFTDDQKESTANNWQGNGVIGKVVIIQDLFTLEKRKGLEPAYIVIAFSVKHCPKMKFYPFINKPDECNTGNIKVHIMAHLIRLVGHHTVEGRFTLSAYRKYVNLL